MENMFHHFNGCELLDRSIGWQQQQQKNNNNSNNDNNWEMGNEEGGKTINLE